MLLSSKDKVTTQTPRINKKKRKMSLVHQLLNKVKKIQKKNNKDSKI